jgi:hypothetical protein
MLEKPISNVCGNDCVNFSGVYINLMLSKRYLIHNLHLETNSILSGNNLEIFLINAENLKT